MTATSQMAAELNRNSLVSSTALSTKRAPAGARPEGSSPLHVALQDHHSTPEMAQSTSSGRQQESLLFAPAHDYVVGARRPDELRVGRTEPSCWSPRVRRNLHSAAALASAHGSRAVDSGAPTSSCTYLGCDRPLQLPRDHGDQVWCGAVGDARRGLSRLSCDTASIMRTRQVSCAEGRTL